VAPLIDQPRVGLASESEVMDWAHRVLGPLDITDDLTSERSSNRVTRALTRAGDPVIVKWFADAPSFFNSVDALNNYSAALGSGAPRLIDHSDSLRAVSMTALAGSPLQGDETLDPTIHFQLGVLLRQFHESAPANRSSDVAKSWATELSRLVDGLEDTIGDVLAMESRSLALKLLDQESLVLSPIHGSIRPEHVLRDPDRGIQVVGFSSTEYDPWIVDVTELERDYWTYSPELRSAFFTGYDRQPDDSDLLVLRARQLLQALRSWKQVSSKRTAKSELSRHKRHLDSALGGTLF
jgi:hypothetical protein